MQMLAQYKTSTGPWTGLRTLDSATVFFALNPDKRGRTPVYQFVFLFFCFNFILESSPGSRVKSRVQSRFYTLPANVVLESSLRANEGRIGVNESILTINETNLDTNEWIFSGNEQQKVYCKTTDENIRDSKTTRLMPREILAGIIYFPQEKAYAENETQLILPSVK